QGAFHKGGGCSQQGDQPHPEDGAGSAEGDGQSDPGQVPGTYPGSETDTEGLKGGYSFSFHFFVGFTAELAYHLPCQPKLNKPSPDGKAKTDTDQGDDQDIRPQKVIDLCSKRFQKRHRITSS